MIHANSRDAYDSERAKLSRRAAAVLEFVRCRGRCTDREIMRGLGFIEPNSVRPRCSELIEAGLLEEVGRIQCSVTRKTVRLVDVKRTAPIQVELGL